MHEIVHDGKTYRTSKFDRGMSKQWAAWLAGKYRAIAAYDREAGELSESEHETELRAIRDLYVNGEFRILSERGTAAMLTEEGAVYLVQLTFGIETEAEAIALMAGKQSEVTEIVKTVLRESFPEVKFKDMPDPNAQAAPPGWISPRRPRRT